MIRKSELISTYGYTTFMNKLSQFIRNIFIRRKGDSAPKDKPASKIICAFCGQPGHQTADCPNSAKFHVFSVDHDADDDGEGQQ